MVKSTAHASRGLWLDSKHPHDGSKHEPSAPGGLHRHKEYLWRIFTVQANITHETNPTYVTAGKARHNCSLFTPNAYEEDCDI